MRRSLLKIKRKIVLLTLILMLISIFSPSYASNKIEYITPSDKSIDEIFEESAEDEFTLSWFNKVSSFPLITKQGKTKQLYINTPNIPYNLTNSIDRNIGKLGYDSIKHSEVKEESIFELREKEPVTAMEKYGFFIPTPEYRGEAPNITYDMSGISPSGFWSGVRATIKFTMNASVFDPPGNDEFKTLSYYSQDYERDFGIERWLRTNWNKIKWTDKWEIYKVKKEDGTYEEKLETETLMPKDESEDEKLTYSVYNIIMNGDRSSPNTSMERLCDYKIGKNKCTASDVLSRLHEELGVNFYKCFRTIVTYDEVDEYMARYVRFMPYDTEMIDTQKFKGGKLTIGELVDDPRIARLSLNNGTLHPDNFIISLFDGGGDTEKATDLNVILTGLFMYISTLFDSFGSFSFLGDTNIGFIYESFAFKIVLGILLIYIVFKIFTIGRKAIFSGDAIGVIMKSLGYIMIMGVIMVLTLNPMGVTDIFKKVVNVDDAITSGIITRMGLETEYYSGDADMERIGKLQYWLPYFNMWTIYNTNHSIFDEDEMMVKDESKPEMKRFKKTPNVTNNLYQPNYGLILANSFTNPECESDSYRVVDHFMAPRLEMNGYNISTSENENYNGDIQTQAGSTWMMSFVVMIVTIFKTLWFYGNVMMFSMLAIYVATSVPRNQIQDVLKGLFNGFSQYIYLSLYSTLGCTIILNPHANFIQSFLVSFVYLVLLFLTVRYILGSRRLKPLFLRSWIN